MEVVKLLHFRNLIFGYIKLLECVWDFRQTMEWCNLVEGNIKDNEFLKNAHVRYSCEFVIPEHQLLHNKTATDIVTTNRENINEMNALIKFPVPTFLNIVFPRFFSRDETGHSKSLFRNNQTQHSFQFLNPLAMNHPLESKRQIIINKRGKNKRPRAPITHHYERSIQQRHLRLSSDEKKAFSGWRVGQSEGPRSTSD